MKLFWKKYRENVVIVAFFVFICGGFYFTVNKIINSINEKTEKIQENLASQERRDKRVDELNKLRNQFEKVKNEENDIKTLISKKGIINLIEEIERIAEITNNRIEIEAKEENKDKKNEKKKKEKKEEDKGIMDKLPSDNYIEMTLMIAGDYNSFMNFIQKVENLKYWSDIVSIKISTSNLGISEDIKELSPFDKERSEEDGKDKAILPSVNANIGIIFYLSDNK